MCVVVCLCGVLCVGGGFSEAAGREVRRWCRRPGREAGRCARCENQARRCFVSLRKSRPSRTLQNRQLAPQNDTRKREDPTCTTGHTLTLQPITSALQEDAPPATSSAAPPSSLTWPCHPESWPACSPPPCASCAPPRAFLSAPPPARKAREKEESLGVQRREFILVGVGRAPSAASRCSPHRPCSASSLR